MYNSAWKKIQQLSWKSQGTTHFTKWAVIIGLDLENVWHRNASSNFKSSKFGWSWCPYRWPQHVLGFWCSRLSDAYGVDILGGRDSARSKSSVLITSGRDQTVRNRFRRWLITQLWLCSFMGAQDWRQSQATLTNSRVCNSSLRQATWELVVISMWILEVPELLGGRGGQAPGRK